MQTSPVDEVRAVPWGARLIALGAGLVQLHAARLDACDPQGSIRTRSRLLCAGLAELAVCCHQALDGESSRSGEVAEAAAMLSLLTKLDDQVIDSLAFHGGTAPSRGALRAKTQAYLAPTLASLRTGTPVSSEPRCQFAADLGRRLMALALPGRFEAIVSVIARGWEIQVDAVATFSAHPETVDLAVVDRVTSEISGAWLLMITLVGALDTPRWLTDAEQKAFFDWGLHIQRADALADLDKDQADGLITTSPGLRAYQRAPDAFLAGIAEEEPAISYRLFAEHAIDLEMLPASLVPLRAALGELGEVGALLEWIHGFLLGRYLAHPLCLRAADDPAFASVVSDWEAWRGLLVFPKRGA